MPLPSPTEETADGADEAREALRIIRERIAAGGPGWTPHKLHPLCLGCKCYETIRTEAPDAGAQGQAG